MKSTNNRKKALLIGIGNASRGDDALGWLFAEQAEKQLSEIFDVEFRYQLQVEDAGLVAEYDHVVFADAFSGKNEKGFQIKPVIPSSVYHFSSHMQSPDAILYLCNTLFGRYPKAEVVMMQGEEWDLGDPVSESAKHYLEEAWTYFLKRVN